MIIILCFYFSENGSDEDVDEEEEDNDSENDLWFVPILEDSAQMASFLLRMQAKHYIPDVALNSLLKFLYAHSWSL